METIKRMKSKWKMSEKTLDSEALILSGLQRDLVQPGSVPGGVLRERHSVKA